MAQFRDFLEEEGLPTINDRIEFLLPVIKNLGTQKLRMIWLKKTINGVSTEFGDADATLNETHLIARHLAFLDLDRLTFKLERFKAERGWYNLNLTRQGIEELLADQSWRRLQIPAEELVFNSFEKKRLWDEIALSLLKKYTERYYTFRKQQWELPHLEYRNLEGDDPNFLCVKESPNDCYYCILIDKSQEEIGERFR